MREKLPHPAGTVQPRLSLPPLPAHGPPNDANTFAVVGIGASAGGLDVCRKLVTSIPAASGMAFILVQHLDPTHASMMVDLLNGHTAMPVLQATDGMPIERDHLYVIPPGAYLSVVNGALHLSAPQARHGARLPFDFLLHSLAEAYGPRAVCVILSGTGADGSLGLRAVKATGGLVIAQEPAEAEYGGMPQSAIGTGDVDHVLPVAKMADALVNHDRRLAAPRAHNGAAPQDGASGWLPEVINLLRTRTPHDFTHYKTGTLQRRIERRAAMAGIEPGDIGRYLERLATDTAELDQLASDLLINVTSFFRDRSVFEHLSERVIPELVRNQPPGQPLRIWTAGCSTGEESYSLAMQCLEAIAGAQNGVKLQLFASDVDPDAIAAAREGFYPQTIEAEMSPERLARFFTKEDRGYRVSPELRSMVIFTVQDVLADPPFSRIDMVSCRNLLIYLQPEAQAKVVALFHFALREGGLLLLGNAETIGDIDGRFKVISKPERLYRRIGRSRLGELGFSMSTNDGLRIPLRAGQGQPPTRQTALAELCQRLVMETYAPAAILINRKHECLYSLGPADRYLRVAPGFPSHDLLAMATPSLRTKLRAVIQQAAQKNARVVIPGDRHQDASFSIAAQPVVSEGEDLLLICFIDALHEERTPSAPDGPQDGARIAELEQELEATSAELLAAIRNLELSNEEQKAINEEALSVNEEYQSANEELLTSKEELQSLNEELTALNSQLQETLDRQRTTSNDLQNVLYSTDVATIFLDPRLNIRFFTPATKSLFNIIPGDVGRPLADLSSLAVDDALLTDAEAVLLSLAPVEREIEARTGAWYLRRVMPYRTAEGVEGVVITFSDVTERRQAGNTLEAAKRQAELATVAKSRFLAAASHDLRQPLQTLSLLQGLLVDAVEGERAQKLVARLDHTVGAMAAMLNTLLDINRIEAGTVHADVAAFPVNDLLDRLREEFTLQAQANHLKLSVLPCSLSVQSDPRLLEQMLRNLVSNALKYTAHGRVLLGCRRREGKLSIELWDTGIGIPSAELHAIFDEYHQLDNAARQRHRGLGLGLTIVRRLSKLLGHPVRVRSQLAKGSVFTIEVAVAAGKAATAAAPYRPIAGDDIASPSPRTGAILIIEDEPDVREYLELLLKDDGHRTAAAADGIAALALVARGIIRPDLILADYNLPGGMDGLQATALLRKKHQIPAIILTGDISTSTLRQIALQNCVHLNKPVDLKELRHVIQLLLPVPRYSSNRGEQEVPPSVQHPHTAHPRTDGTNDPRPPVIFVVDDDRDVRETIRAVLEEGGHTVEDYASCEAFLEAYHPGRDACLLIDACLPGMSGLELLQRLHDDGHQLPSIMITGNGDVPMAVHAMKAGAADFIEKPVSRDELLESIERALEQSRDASKLAAWREEAASHVASLTPRQRIVMELVLAGHPSKNIAADLGISQRTVENHRAAIMKKTGSKSLPALARLALAAAN